MHDHSWHINCVHIYILHSIYPCYCRHLPPGTNVYNKTVRGKVNKQKNSIQNNNNNNNAAVIKDNQIGVRET